MHLVILQVSEDDKTEANEKRSAGVMAMNEGEVVFLYYVYCNIMRKGLSMLRNELFYCQNHLKSMLDG